MQVYSEYYDGDRKATITRLDRHWNDFFTVWEVAMYVNGKPIQRATLKTESEASAVAQDFVRGYDSAPTLLNEHISNG